MDKRGQIMQCFEKRKRVALRWAGGALLLGLLYYLFMRENTLFLGWLGIRGEVIWHTSSDLLSALPTFLHVLAFSLLTWVLLNLEYPLFSTLVWVGINLLFELLQLLPAKEAGVLPPFLYRYAVNGTFSGLDVAAIFFASMVYFSIVNTHPEKDL